MKVADNEQTRYSAVIAGEARNHDFAVRFDINESGFLGISQRNGDNWTDRVLLSPKQVRSLRAFLRERFSND